VIYALLGAPDDAVRERQMAHLDQHGDTGIATLTRHLYARMDKLEVALRLPVIDLALPSLRQLSAPQHALFRKNLRALREMDAELSLFEWCLARVVRHHLNAGHKKSHPMREPRLHIARAPEACAMLLSALAHAGEPGDGNAEAAFAAALQYLQLPGLALRPPEAAGFSALNHAVDQLERLGPLHKRRLLRACIACIHADGVVTPEQAELLRAISDALDCPMPPMVSG